MNGSVLNDILHFYIVLHYTSKNEMDKNNDYKSLKYVFIDLKDNVNSCVH